ncbi:HAD domain-containing protein [Herminiimonas aquatilis]|uniref:HAD domain-containing protein n=1 Tax=Herminiimonas aquatilis TaxID=345342 RepID=A0ABW2J4U2_9BURK
MNTHPYFRRFIYLDFDSVLHHDSVYIHPTKGIYMREPGFTLFEWMPFLEQLLEAHPDVGIILSTSWVRVKSFSYAKSKLSSELQKRVIGATFHKGHMNKELFAQLSRASQILGDVSRRGFGDEDWIAIDDEAEGWPLMYAKNLIRTEWAGISDPEVQAELNIWLNKVTKA